MPTLECQPPPRGHRRPLIRRPATPLLLLMLLTMAWPARADDGTGVITGVVRLNGDPPSLASHKPARDTEVCGPQPRRLQSLTLGPGREVANAIVYLGATSVRQKTAAPKNLTVSLDQQDCEFSPRIQVVRAGATLWLKNSDPTLHIVRIESLGHEGEARVLLEAATPYAGYEKKFQLANFTEPVLLRATGGPGRPWMTAYLAVLPHSLAALSGEDGRFTIRNVPPGRHRLYVWHEVLGTIAREVTVTGKRASNVAIEYDRSR
jgi:hypothetical protein